MNFLESLRIIFVIFGSPMHFKAGKKSTNFGVLVGVLDVMVGVLGVLIGGFPESSLNVLNMFSGCSLSAPVSALY